MSIMGEEFGEQQTSARVPAFDEPTSGEPAKVEPTAAAKLTDRIFLQARSQRRQRRVSAPQRADRSVRQRLFQLEERRIALEEQRNVELAGMRASIDSGMSNIMFAFEEIIGLLRRFVQK